MGKRIQANICAECWNEWLRNYSIKVINEMRLDLSTERGQEVYDQMMCEFFGEQYRAYARETGRLFPPLRCGVVRRP